MAPSANSLPRVCRTEQTLSAAIVTMGDSGLYRPSAILRLRSVLSRQARVVRERRRHAFQRCERTGRKKKGVGNDGWHAMSTRNGPALLLPLQPAEKPCKEFGEARARSRREPS